MIALLMQSDIGPSHGTIDALRAYIADTSVPKYQRMPGLRLKIFLSDAANDTFGALYLWEDEASLEAALPQLGTSIREQTGDTPRFQRFDVEAIVEGRHATPDLSRVGRAVAARA